MSGFIAKFQARLAPHGFTLIRKIGHGGHAKVYHGRDNRTGASVALKLEHISLEPSMLCVEFEMLRSVHEQPGFPRVVWYGCQDDYKILVMELLGPGLADLPVYCGGHFTLKTTLLIADQLLERLELLHAKGLVHRDVKPENFVLGTASQGNVLFLIYLGIADEYTPPQKPRITPLESSEKHNMVGTARYASKRGHLGLAQQPRDDLESLGYMLIYLLRGVLPWQGLQSKDEKEKHQLIYQKKQSIPTAELCQGLPLEFADYMLYLETREAEIAPNYAMLRNSFRRLASRYRYAYDYAYDWTIKWYFQNRVGIN